MEKELRVISDTSLITYLTVAGFKQSGHPVLLRNYLQFSFEQTRELEDAIERYYLREAQVDALTLLEGYRTIKAWIAESKKNKGGDCHDGNK